MAWDDTKSAGDLWKSAEYNAMVTDQKTRVVGPASATANAIVRYDLTTGKLVKDSPITIADSGAIAGALIPESCLSLTDLTTADVSTSKHGLCPKAPNTYTFLNGLGAWGNRLASLGINTDPSYLLHIKGDSTTDLPTYSDEFLDADNWTSTGWTGSFATGWTHTPGNTTILSHDHAAVNATKYQVTYTVTGRTAGTFTITFGGQTSDAISSTGAWGPTTTGTGVLEITPQSTFDGTIVISIKSLDAVSTPLVYFESSSGAEKISMRATGLSDNIFIGYLSGGYDTTGYRNTSIGSLSLQNNTSGNYNSALGYNALGSNTTGNNNSALGYGALQSNTTGNRNLAFGYFALNANTTGSYNTSLGVNSLQTATSGSSNTASGYYSLQGLTSGNYNSALGVNSGRSITTGGSNTLIGYQAGYDANQKADAENSISLGANSFCNRSNQVVIGDENVVETQLRTGVYIGSTSTTAHTQPTARLHIAAGAAGAGTAPLKLTAGTLNTTPEAGAIEFDGTNMYFTRADGTRKTFAVV